jgi:hypothetical protein
MAPGGRQAVGVSHLVGLVHILIPRAVAGWELAVAVGTETAVAVLPRTARCGSVKFGQKAIVAKTVKGSKPFENLVLTWVSPDHSRLRRTRGPVGRKTAYC